jgi:hypothetical protein
MKQYWEFLKEEIRKPIEALKITLIYLVQFLALLFLRLVLWCLFFLLPVILLFSFAFHMMTNQAKRLLPSNAVSSNLPVIGQLQNNSVSRNLLSLKTVNEDARFWLRELERLKY